MFLKYLNLSIFHITDVIINTTCVNLSLNILKLFWQKEKGKKKKKGCHKRGDHVKFLAK